MFEDVVGQQPDTRHHEGDGDITTRRGSTTSGTPFASTASTTTQRSPTSSGTVRAGGVRDAHRHDESSAADSLRDD